VAATSAFHRGASGTIDELAGHQPNGIFVARRTWTAAQLRRLPRKQNLAPRPPTNQPDGQITSDFPKSCQALESRIFRWSRRANQ
jgi:hypothetical protein